MWALEFVRLADAYHGGTQTVDEEMQATAAEPLRLV
jgi:hypothetical protein